MVTCSGRLKLDPSALSEVRYFTPAEIFAMPANELIPSVRPLLTAIGIRSPYPDAG